MAKITTMTYLPILLAVLITIVVSSLIFFVISRANARAAQAKIEALRSSLTSLNSTLELYKNVNSDLEVRLKTQSDQFAENQQNARNEFEKIASEILDAKTRKFDEESETKLKNLLTPLGISIADFKTKVEQSLIEQTKQRSSLEAQVKQLFETTQKVGAEANNLASALKGDVKKMGNWGEMILESILENSGLERGVHFLVQSTIEDEESGAKLRPDIIVNLPEGRSVIIDSKVSLRAYDRYCSADNETLQTLALKEHHDALVNHIDSLAAKNYDNLPSSLDFTMMFIPIEPAYLLAIRNDSELWAYAYSKRILLISPTNLIACLKLISDLWKREMQSKNAQEIVKRAELMYEKFCAFSSTMEKLGDSISKTQTAYSTALSQLKDGRGNLYSQAETMRSLGLKSSKRLKSDD